MTNDLFSATKGAGQSSGYQPLAARLRPADLKATPGKAIYSRPENRFESPSIDGSCTP
jgi:hypothetical protein